MIYKNVEIHNIKELIPHKDGGVTWCRIPQNVYDNLSTDSGKRMAIGSTGVEIRFVVKSGDGATLKMELLNEMNEHVINNLRFPVIVKPVDRSGSRGIRKVDSREALFYAIKKHMR